MIFWRGVLLAQCIVVQTNALQESDFLDVHIIEGSPNDSEVSSPPPLSESSVEEKSETDEDFSYNATAAKDVKTVISIALEKQASNLRKVKPQEVIALFKKHRLKLTIMAAIIAFRKEIKFTVSQALSIAGEDPKTGRMVLLSPTMILKLLVVTDIARRWQAHSMKREGQDHKSDEDQKRNLAPVATAFALVLGRRMNPFLALLLAPLLSNGVVNTAYIPPVKQHYTFERVNDRYTKDDMAFLKATGIQGGIQSTSTDTSTPQLLPNESNQTMIVMDMTDMDTSVSQMSALRDEVSFILSTVDKHSESSVEVLVLLESPGGSAPDYSLAAEQLLRLRKNGVKVTVCVDKVAASGGYMIACTSSPGCLFAAPFAVLGSIGVIGQQLNVHKTLEGWGVQPLIFRGGRHKAPVGLVGEVTQDGIDKVQDMVDKVHTAFKRHVAKARPLVAQCIEDLATGENWIGYDALEVGLIDRVITSDEYIGQRLRGGTQVLKLVQMVRRKYPFQSPQAITEVRDRPLQPSAQVFLDRALRLVFDFLGHKVVTSCEVAKAP